MRLPVRFCVSFAAVAALAVLSAPFTGAQTQVQSSPPQSPVNGTYVTIDPLANIHYDNRYVRRCCRVRTSADSIFPAPIG